MLFLSITIFLNFNHAHKISNGFTIASKIFTQLNHLMQTKIIIAQTIKHAKNILKYEIAL
jgi:hypothetical protein